MGEHFVVYEDRREAIVGVKLLALSLFEHVPDASLTVYSPGFSDFFPQWLEKHCPRANAVAHTPLRRGWDVKPEIISLALQEHETAFWLDSDILVTGPLGEWLQRLSKDVLVVAQDAKPEANVEARCGYFGLTIGRSLPGSVCGGVLRFSRSHRAVLEEWSRLLGTEAYAFLRENPEVRERLQVFTDQDTLEAVVASRAFADVKMAYLWSGKEHITAIVPEAFGVRRRLAIGFRLREPLVVHAQGLAPWFAQKWTGLLLAARWQTNPYIRLAAHYSARIPEEDLSWISRANPVTRLCRILTFGNAYFQGIPLIFINALARRWFAILYRRSCNRDQT